MSKTLTTFSAVSILTTLIGIGSAIAATTGSLFFNVNASDPGSYSPSVPSKWTDLSTEQRDGSIVGTLTYNSSTGALEFPGGSNSTNSEGYVDMGAGFNNFGTGITVEFEGHFGAVNQAWERIFDFGNGDANENIWVGVFGEGFAPNELAIELWDGSTGKGRCISTGGILTTNAFAKYVITMDGSKCRMYKNGVEIQTRVGDGGSSGSYSTAALGSTYSFLPKNVTRQNNYIGRSNWGTDAAFNGAIKYVRIYTEALTSSDVTNNSTTYTLTYSTTGSESGTAPSAKSGNGLITLDANTGTLAKVGHTFQGWALTANQSTAISGTYNLTADATLYPAFLPNTYSVTYEENGGSLVSDGSFTHGGTLTFPTDPTRSSFTFKGWFATSTGGTALTAATVAAGNASVTLHAQWEPVVNSTVGITPVNSSTSETTQTLAKTGFDLFGKAASSLVLVFLGFSLLLARRVSN